LGYILPLSFDDEHGTCSSGDFLVHVVLDL
jgi:hypothetical protein